jgi:hypothetical protein
MGDGVQVEGFNADYPFSLVLSGVRVVYPLSEIL